MILRLKAVGDSEQFFFLTSHYGIAVHYPHSMTKETVGLGHLLPQRITMSDQV